MKYVILDPNLNGKDFVLMEIAEGLQRAGHSASSLTVCQKDSLVPLQDIGFLLDIEQPDRILWRAGVGFAFQKLWDREPWNKVPKISLNYDEPFSRICKSSFEDEWRAAGQRSDFLFGIWDGYWRKRSFEKWDIQSHACHLAANELPTQPRKPSDGIVFYGMLQSIAQIIHRYNKLTVELQAVVRRIDYFLTSQVKLAADGKPSADIKCGEDLIQQFGLMEIHLARYEVQRNMRWIVWALAKNAVRLRMLRTILRNHKLTMYCDTQQLGHASEPEIHQMLSDVIENLTIVDTSNWSTSELAMIPTFGKLHVQATDPQSVEGGIPWRVFQTAACGKALLTDEKPELFDAFQEGKEILCYNNSTKDLDCVLDDALSNPARFEEIGEASRQRFIKDHTWANRIAEWEGWIKDQKPDAYSSFGDAVKKALDQLQADRLKKMAPAEV